MKLSKRLQAIADYVTTGNRVADVGTDHAYVPIYLVEEGISPSAIAADIGKGPLARAQENIRLHGLEDRIKTRLSDGLTAFSDGECDSLILAGMGGGLMASILEKGSRISFAEYILEPQSEQELLRTYLAGHGLVIDRETMVLEDEKFYPVLHVATGSATGKWLRYGDPALQENKEILMQYLEKEASSMRLICEKLTASGSEAGLARRKILEQDLKENETMQEALRKS